MRYFLLDQITEIVEEKSAKGIKCITLTEEILQDHFPMHPIFPGALIVEGMAQLAGFLLEVTFNHSDTQPLVRAVMAQIDKIKFYETSGPGDRLIYEVQISSRLNSAAQTIVTASCDGQLRAKGSITFAMMPIATPAVTLQRQELYQIWTRSIQNPPIFR